MRLLRSFRDSAAIAMLIGCLCLLLPRPALAHAVLMRATPAQHATVKAGDLAITLTYNSRIDASRSALALLSPDGKRRTLSLEQHGAPNVLRTTAAGLSAGSYTLQWQVLATDGHITRGALEFRVD